METKETELGFFWPLGGSKYTRRQRELQVMGLLQSTD